jgi:hypothetical protein
VNTGIGEAIEMNENEEFDRLQLSGQFLHFCMNRCLVILRRVRRLLVTANVVLSSPIILTLMMVALSCSETSVLTTATRRNIPEDANLDSHGRENLISYKIYLYSEHILISYPNNL